MAGSTVVVVAALLCVVLAAGVGMAKTRAPAGSSHQSPGTATVGPELRQLSRGTPAIAPGRGAGAVKAWSTVFADDFEGDFPGTEWSLYAAEGTPTWGDWTCWSGSTPDESIGCAVAGTGAITCGGDYAPNMNAAMIYGPFALDGAGVTAAEFAFEFKLQCEDDGNPDDYFDRLFWGASTDGGSFSGFYLEGTAEGSRTFDLASYIGEAEVWVALLFESDGSVQFPDGAQIDDFLLRIDATVANEAPTVSLLTPDGGETLYAGASYNITWTADDADAGPDPLSIAIDYSSDAGGTWDEVVADLSDSGGYLWTVPAQTTSTGRIRVRASDGQDESNDVSDSNFSIVESTNLLDLGTATGASGETVAVVVSLSNDTAVKAFQFDVLYDEGVATCDGVDATARGAGMTAETSLVSAGRTRVVAYHDDASLVAAGTGEVARLTFSLAGAGGTGTALLLSNIVVSDADAVALPTAADDGRVDVEAATSAPEVAISVLNNPGRTRHLLIAVKVVSGSGNAPTVTAGGSAVSMTALGGGVYTGNHYAAQGTGSVTVEASDTNGQGTGTDQVLVQF